jgi:hypothetical protein
MLLWLLVHIEAFLEKTRHDTWTLHQRGRGSTQEWNVSRFSQSKGASKGQLNYDIDGYRRQDICVVSFLGRLARSQRLDELEFVKYSNNIIERVPFLMSLRSSYLAL